MAAPTLLPKARRLCTHVLESAAVGNRLITSTGRASPVGRGPETAQNFKVKFATTHSEWEQAFRLVADNYQARGYEADEADYRFTPYHALPDTVVLIAKRADCVVATFTLVADNTLLGLPMEDLYRAEVEALRHQGRNLFETTCLADRDLNTRQFVEVFLALIRLAWQYGIGHGGKTATNVITVNPRHVAFYRKVLGYVPLGERRSYDQVNGHPAEAFYLDLPLMRARVPQIYDRLFGERLPGWELLPRRLPAEEVRRFAGSSSQTSPRAVEQILWHTEHTDRLRRW